MPVHNQLFTSGSNREFVQALTDQKVNFLVVGGMAVAFHNCRDLMAVDDLDLMLEPTAENIQRFVASLRALALDAKWSSDDLARPNIQVPIKQDYYIDVLTPPDGIEFQPLTLNSLAARLRVRLEMN